MVPTITRRMLRSGDVEDLRQVPQLIFGALVEIVAGTITHYHSDLYHDAQWIAKHVVGTETVSFWYSYGALGTHIGFSDNVRGSSAYTVRVTVELADLTARITIAPVSV